MLNKELEMAKEIEVASLYTELNISAATRLVSEQYKKSCSNAGQQKEQPQTFNDIISDTEDVDNGPVTDKDTGYVKRDLIEEEIWKILLNA